MNANSFELDGFSANKRALLASLLDASNSDPQKSGSIKRRKSPSEYPLSAGQRRLWFLDRLEGGSHYNENLSVRIQGKFEHPAVQMVLQEILKRHEAMRSVFVLVDGEPVQRIAPEQPVNLPVIDLSAVPESSRLAEANRLAVEEAGEPFELDRGPLWRFTLLRLAECDYILLVIAHHIAMDGWSAKIFWKEFGILYEAFRTGQQSPLPEPPIQYADYAAWQTEWNESEAAVQQLNYWTKRLANTPPLLELPTDRPRPPIQTFRGSVYFFAVPQGLVTELRVLGRRVEATFFMTLLAAFQVLLARYAQQDDIAVGTPVSNRSHQEIEGLIGFFVNTLVMRGDLSGDPSFLELLRRIRQTALDAFNNQDLPFEKFVESLRAERTQAHSPLFQVLLIHQNAPKPTFEAPGVSVSAFKFDSGISKFDLTLSVREEPTGLSCAFEFNSDLFDADRIERMAGHLLVLLQGIVADPERRLSELPLLTEPERSKLLVEWNNTKSDFAVDACVHELFEAQAKATPEAVALEFQGQQLTYSELNERSAHFARHLQTLGVGPNVAVAVCLDRSVELVVALLGILKAGGAYLPIDLTFPANRVAFMLEDAQPRVLVTLRGLVANLPPHGSDVVCIDDYAPSEATPLAQRPESRHLAYIIYTSGSTGRPKGVEICHRSVVNFLASMRRAPGLKPHDTLFSVTTPSFDIFGLEIWLPLSTGAKVAIASPAAAKDGSELKAMIERCGSTLMQATPSTWRLLLEAGWQGKPDLNILCGGEAWSPQLAEQLLPRCGSLWNMYGPTETTIWSSVYRVVKGDRILLGRPIANTCFYVVDSHLQLVPVGIPGELLIGGDGVARGYRNRPELTANKFVTDPFTAGAEARLYRTGDLVRYLPDGNLEFIGRIDKEVKIRGFRIDLEEIENVLRRRSDIRDAVVVVREVGEKQLVAYTVPAQEQAYTAAELRDYLKGELPDYMIPSAWVRLPALPLTANGKLDRKALPVPGAEAGMASSAAFVAPHNNTEQKIATIWQDVLGIAKVGRDDNFFDLGGHSLLMVRVHSQLKQAFSKEITMVDMFGYTTVRTLANHLAGQDPNEGLAPSPSAVRIPTLRRRQMWRDLAEELLNEPS